MDVVVLVLAGTATALATGLGVLPVWWLGESADRLRAALWGVTIGVMGVASVVGLLEPALDTGQTARWRSASRPGWRSCCCRAGAWIGVSTPSRG